MQAELEPVIRAHIVAELQEQLLEEVRRKVSEQCVRFMTGWRGCKGVCVRQVFLEVCDVDAKDIRPGTRAAHIVHKREITRLTNVRAHARTDARTRARARVHDHAITATA